MLTLGQGYSANIAELHVKVELQVDGWHYRVAQRKGDKVVVDWELAEHSSTAKYAEAEQAKFEAVYSALLFLQSRHNPHEVLPKLKWAQYGPAH